MASNIVRVVVDADTQGFIAAFRNARDEGAGFGEALGASIKQVGSLFAVDLAQNAVRSVSAFVGESLTQFQDLTESTNAMRVVFGDAAEELLAIGENSATSLGISQAEFNEAAVAMAGFAENIAGEGGDIVQVTDDLIQRAADFASVHNIDVTKALEIFQSTLAGQTEPIRRYSIDVSAAAAEQFALATGIIDTDRELSESEKQVARYGLLMQETAVVAGDFARTSGDVANQTRILTARVKDQQAELGEQLLPLQSQWLDIQSQLIPVLGDVASTVGELTGAMSEGDIVAAAFRDETGKLIVTAEDLREAVDFNVASLGLFRDESANATETAIALTEAGFLEREELVRLRDQVDLVAEAHGLTADETAELNDVIDDAIEKFDDDKQAALEMARMLNQRYRPAQKNSKEATAATTEAIKEQASVLLAAADPAVNLLRKLEDLDEANRNYQEALADSESSQDDVRAAAIALALAQGELDAAANLFAADGGPAAIGALETLLSRAGVARNEIDGIRTSLALLNDMDVTATARINVIGGQVVRVGDRQISLNQEGGIATGPNLGVFGEAGNEALIPLDSQRGIDALAAAFKEALGDGVGTTINVSGVGGMDARELARQISLEARFS